MCDETVVTVRWETGARDYALPLQVPIRDWLPLLSEDAAPGKPAALRFCGETLDPSRSLASYGVWDGSLLTLTARERG